MVGTNAVTVKVMPKSPDTDLEKIKKEIQEKLRKAINIQVEEKEIAFGLKALILLIAWPENEDTDAIENILMKVRGVSSVTIEDIRRAFG